MSLGNGKPFVKSVDLELKRAERYRIFVSLIVLDLAFVDTLMGDESHRLLETIFERVRAGIREVDNAAVVGCHQLVLLLPETPRQGAELAARRLRDTVRSILAEQSDRFVDQMVPLEMASYPDAAGAKTIREFLGELLEAS